MNIPLIKLSILTIAACCAALCAACANTTETAGDSDRPNTYEVTGSLINRPLVAHVDAADEPDVRRGANSVSQLLGGGSPAQGILPK